MRDEKVLVAHRIEIRNRIEDVFMKRLKPKVRERLCQSIWAKLCKNDFTIGRIIDRLKEEMFQ